MLLRLLCATAPLVLLTAPTIPPQPAATPFYPQVKRVQCSSGSGSAVLTERGFVSAAHVTNIGGCEIEGHPIVAAPEKGLDFSTIRVAIQGRGLRINCGGFQAMHWYYAVGFAGGYEWQTLQRHVATFADSPDGLRILLGTPTVIPGMSGGLVMDESGAIVGIVNAYNSFFGASYSRALKDTSLCRS